MGVTPGVGMTMSVLVLVLVLVMMALVTTGCGRIVLAGEVILDCFERLGLVRPHRNDPAGGHALAEALPVRAGNQDIDGIERMRARAVPIVHGELLGEVKTIDLFRLRARFGFEHQEPPRPPGVRGDGAEVLAGDGNSHVSILLERCDLMASANLKAGQQKGGGAQRGCLFPAPAPFAAPVPRRAALRQPELGDRLVDLPAQDVQELRRI